MFISFSLLSSLFFNLCAPQSPKRYIGQSTFQVGQGVQTTSGFVFGHAAKTATDVSEYLGIPFAQPPVGDLRFAAPQPYKGIGNITASNYVRLKSYSTLK
jgi:hypothetical protein